MSSGATKRNLFVRSWPFLLVLCLAALFAAERLLIPRPLNPFQARREMMDTWVSITVYDEDEAHAAAALEAAFVRMQEVVEIASTFDPEAEAARLNEQGRLDDASPELIEMLTEARRFSDVSDGTFDVTIEPLLALWRFDPQADAQFWELDTAAQRVAIDEAKALAGSDRIVLGPGARVELLPGTQVTLGGIAKGYVVDQGLQALRDAGIEHALIDAGGDIGVYGGKPGGAAWEISLRHPEDEAPALATFELFEGAIATSGNYLRYFDPEAQVGHIMDPRTGQSAFLSSSATVIAGTCTEADALATAVFVLGPVEGLGMVEGLEGVEAMVLDHDDPTEIARSEHLDRYEIRKKDGT